MYRITTTTHLIESEGFITALLLQLLLAVPFVTSYHEIDYTVDGDIYVGPDFFGDDESLYRDPDIRETVRSTFAFFLTIFTRV